MRCQFLLTHSCFVQREIRAKSGPQIANSSLNANLGFSNIQVHTKAQLRFEKQPELALKCLHSLFSMFPRQSRAQLLPMAKAPSQRKNWILPVLEPGLTPWSSILVFSIQKLLRCQQCFPGEQFLASGGVWNIRGLSHLGEGSFRVIPAWLPEPKHPVTYSQSCSDHGKASGEQVGKFLLQTSNFF